MKPKEAPSSELAELVEYLISIEEEIGQLDHAIEIKCLKAAIVKEKATRSRHKGNISTLDKEIKLFEKERKKDSNGICVDFENTLSDNSIPYKYVFGGHMPYSVGRVMMKRLVK